MWIRFKKLISWTGYSKEAEPLPGRPVGLAESRSLDHAHPALGTAVRSMQADSRAIYRKELIVTSVYRSLERQSELYRIGRRGIPGEKVVTHFDGFERRSRHNDWPSTAVDLAVDIEPGVPIKIVWNEADYEFIGILARKHGLEWGGHWASFRDMPHVQLPRNVA